MSILYIRLPSKAAADTVPHWPALSCPFALTTLGSAIEREGTAPLADLSDVVAGSQRVVVMLAASDVTVLRLQVPPLSPARLKAALPNLVEEKLISDASGCVVVAGGTHDGMRTIAVVQRAWLDMLANTLISLGARHLSAAPAQLCLPYPGEQPDSVTAAIADRNDAGGNNVIDVTLRLSEQDGIGLAITPVTSQGGEAEKNRAAVQEAIQTLCAVVPQAPVTLYVPQHWVRAYQEIISESADLGGRITVSADNWSRWIAGANAVTLDLMPGLGKGAAWKIDWRSWRWPLALAVAVLLVNAAALNISWWKMKSESRTLRTAMIQIYKSAYPKESVIIDPIAQMQQKIAIAKHNSGQAAPDDFTALTAAFGQAWTAVAGKPDAIAAIEYHDRSLSVRLNAGANALTQRMREALAMHNLTLAEPATAAGQPGAVVWQIRSTK